MLKITQFNDVTRIDSARTIANRGYYWTTAYLVDGLLVDTGCAYTAKELVAWLSGEQVSQLITTHSHEDHIGANGILLNHQPALKLYSHPLAVPILENPRETQPLQFYRRVMWGWPGPSNPQPVSDGEVLETEKYRFQVIYTPGHSPDHLCLYEQSQGWLFSGDLFIGGQDRALREDNHIWEIITSLKRAASLPLTRLFPGCARVKDNPKAALAEKIEYLEKTGEKVLELHKQGFSIDQIARSLFGGPMMIEAFTLGHFTRRNLIQSYLSKKWT